MKIVSLTAENVKKLTVVQITPNGNLVQITGKNGQGKSSVLDSIWWALAGKSAIQSAPIRKGATEAKITLNLGDIIVRRSFAAAAPTKEGEKPAKEAYTTSIIVENADGARFPSPQKMLDELLGALSFDPLAFASMGAANQFETLKGFVPGVDFKAIESADAIDYETRTAANRQAKDALARASEITIPEGTPTDAISETALVAKLEAAGRQNTEIMQRQERRAQAQAVAQSHRENATRLRESAASMRAQANADDAAANNCDANAVSIEKNLADAGALPDPVDTATIRTEIDKARETNRHVEARARKANLEKIAAEFAAKAKALSDKMSARQADKRAKIAAAKLPIPNVEFGEGAILMNGVPFDQASDAEKLRASVAIAMAMNPKLRVIRVRDGSLLDEDGFRLIAEMADANDCQVWIERVDSSGKIGFVLEDGHLKDMAEAKEAAE